jgi:hypothetical protein
MSAENEAFFLPFLHRPNKTDLFIAMRVCCNLQVFLSAAKETQSQALMKTLNVMIIREIINQPATLP